MPAEPKNAKTTPRPRTLTEALRLLDTAGLVELLEARPDLCYPLPRDLSELSSRAATSTSINRAVDQLNAWQRTVCEAMAALPDPASVLQIAALVRADGAGLPDVAAAVSALRRRALCWGTDDDLHLLRGVRDFFEPYPGGLAPPSAHPLRSADIDAALAASGETVRPVLERLLWGSPTGAVRNATRVIDLAQAHSPIEQLLACRLLRPLDDDTVILPREVSLRLRGGSLTPEPVPTTPPELSGRVRDPSLIDKAAAGAAFGILHDLELAIHALESTPHRILRTGGLAARDITVLAKNLGTDVRHATFIMECAAAARLVASGDNLTLLPTTSYDRWVSLDAEARWQLIMNAWMLAPRQFSAASEGGSRALGPEADSSSAPGLRRLIMEQAAAAGVGTVITVADLAAAVGWYRPRLAVSAELSTLVSWIWQEANWLGLAALGAVSSYGSVALQPDSEMPARLVELFPTPIDKIIIQADLTAVAPGPLPHGLAAELRLLANQESRGGGGVFRFSAATLRRALDAGWSAPEVHAWLAEHSATSVPQPLAYLVDDVARLHGSVRVGSAVSYVRTDEAHTAALLADPAAAGLGLRAIAPGVLISLAEPDEVVALLRNLGLAPSAEDSRGRTLAAPSQRRAIAAQQNVTPTTMSAAEAAAAIAQSEARSARGENARTSMEETLERLTSAAKAESRVRVVYVASDGTQAERDVNPLGLGSGMMRAVDTSSSQVITIPLARISSVRPAVSET